MVPPLSCKWVSEELPVISHTLLAPLSARLIVPPFSVEVVL